MMKKSTFGAVLAFLFAAAGALTAAAIYLYRRERELDEYERLLFSDDYEDEDADEDFEDEPVYEKIRTSLRSPTPRRKPIPSSSDFCSVLQRTK